MRASVIAILICFFLGGHELMAKPAKVAKKTIDPKILAVMNWGKRGVSLETALKRAGWWTPTKKFFAPPQLTVLENKKQTQSVATVLRTRGIASVGKSSVVEAEAKKECLRTKTQNAGEKLHFKYDKNLEIAACWITHRTEKKEKQSGHSFMVFRSIEKGSKAFVVENTYVVMDKIAGEKGPHPSAVKIAQLIGAL